MPLKKIVGVPNPLIALMAKQCGFDWLYLSGASLSSQYGMPDLGVLTINDLCEAARRITLTVDTPLIVDIDNGWNHPLLLERGVRELKQAGVFAVQIEDQGGVKRCGHLTIKELVSTEEMCRKIQTIKSLSLKAVARSDALSLEGIDKTVDRAKAYEKAGADFFFLEGVQEAQAIRQVRKAITIPLMINLTEFGKTPLWKPKELEDWGVDLILYPMSVNRVMYQAALEALQALQEGSQDRLIEKMMSREALYKLIDYQAQERKL